MQQAYGLYTHIRANRIRSALLLAGLFLLVYVMVYAGALAGRALLKPDASLAWYLRQAWSDLLVALPFASAGALLWIFVAYHFHQWLIDTVTGGREITRKEEPRLYNLLENLCISRGIAMPKLKVMEARELNAFAAGLNQKQYSITVTRGLLDRLDDAETEAVLAHELTHIRNGDVRMLVIAVVIAGIVGFFAELVFRAMFHAGGSGRPSTWSSRRGGNGDRKGGGGAILAIIIALVLIALAWLLSQAIRFALSRSREYLADAGAAELTKNPDAMILALRKIEGRGELPDTPSAVMEMCVDNPRSGVVDLFATHPSVDKRIDALVRFAGGKDPGPLALPDYDHPNAIEEGAAEPAPDSPAAQADAVLPDRPAGGAWETAGPPEALRNPSLWGPNRGS